MKDIDYAKRGWKFLGFGVLWPFVYVILGMLFDNIAKIETQKWVLVLFYLTDAFLFVVSLINFWALAKKRKIFLLISLLEIMFVAFLLWIAVGTINY